MMSGDLLAAGGDQRAIGHGCAAEEAGGAAVGSAFGDKRQLFGEAVLCRRAYGTARSAEGQDARSVVRAMLWHLADYTDPRHPLGCLIISATANCGTLVSEAMDVASYPCVQNSSSAAPRPSPRRRRTGRPGHTAGHR
ncbi:hypothetical protein [Streptomyces sp. NPDC002994]|uniref:hypothetical protein n=1 Tax=Streptomyces sp. NPDC002994 TaxID=3154441 RepID=UPI0033AAEA15